MSDFELFIELRSAFKDRLQRKTGWGRAEALEEFDEAAKRVVTKRRAAPAPFSPYSPATSAADPQYPEPLPPFDPEYPSR